MTDSVISYQNVTKEFGNILAVDNVSFEIESGELLALLGPSGSGKTTTLRMLAGFEQPDKGTIKLGDRNILNIPPHHRDAGMVFQDYALFPHMSVGDNIRFGLKRQSHSPDEIDARVKEVLEMVDLPDFQDRKPSQLSGGQQQRVATARALALKPRVLLMDEPLGALDKKLRDQLQVELVELQERTGVTTMYVTHNQQEALTIADRVAVMNKGQIEQIGTPTEIYETPKTEFVADFIGNANFLDGEPYKTDNSIQLGLNGQDIKLNVSHLPDDDCRVFVRPEKITVMSPNNNNKNFDNTITATVDQVLFLGDKIKYMLSVGKSELTAEMENRGTQIEFSPGEEVKLGWSQSNTQLVES